MKAVLHRSLTEIERPPRVARLPLDDRGYPIPWFVATVSGRPDFRVVRPGGVQTAIADSRCWICGQLLIDTRVAYVVGPMCAVNRTSSEPPSHRDCARYAAQACPFLARPHARRRETGLPADANEPAGTMIRRNPGVALVWITRRPVQVWNAPNGVLFDLGRSVGVEWWARGREATRSEVLDSIESGMPILRNEAAKDGSAAMLELERLAAAAMDLVPT